MALMDVQNVIENGYYGTCSRETGVQFEDKKRSRECKVASLWDVMITTECVVDKLYASMAVILCAIPKPPSIRHFDTT